MELTVKKFSSFDHFKTHVFNRANQLIPKMMNPIPSVTNRRARNEKGLVHSFNLIQKSAENYYYNMRRLGGVDSIDAMFSNFSNTPGMEAVRNVHTITALDVTLASMTKSLIPFLAIERGMDSDSVQIFYRDVVALAAAGGFTQGETVLGNFTSPSNKINLGNQIATTAPVEGDGNPVQIDLGSPLIPGTVKLISSTSGTLAGILLANTNYTAEDVKKDGKLFAETGGATAETFPAGTVVDYATGIISIGDSTAGSFLYVTAVRDITGEKTGENTLKLTTKMANTLLTSENIRLINQESIEDLNFINKIQAQIKSGGAKLDYAALGMKDLTSIYIQYINLRLINSLLEVNPTAIHAQTNISSFAVATSDANTKNDFVNKFMIDLSQSVLSTSGLPATAYVVGTRGANILMNVKDRFKALPSAMDELNGVIGSYDNIPVIRHSVIDADDQARIGASKCTVRAVYKDPSNEAAVLAYGEFLPMYVSASAVNFENPSQFSRALFAQNGVKVIHENLVRRGEIQFAV